MQGTARQCAETGERLQRIAGDCEQQRVAPADVLLNQLQQEL